jgi:Fe-S cluster biogenesis protein NfuA
MASWFQKVLGKGIGQPPGTERPIAAPEGALPQYGESPEPDEGERRVVYAPLLEEDEPLTPASDEGIPIRAEIARDNASCRFIVGAPLLDEDISIHFHLKSEAMDNSQLALAVLEVEGVESVLLHGREVIVFSPASTTEQWEARMRTVAQQIRRVIESDEEIIRQEVLDWIPPEDELRKRVARVIDEEINPGIAAHSGVITLENVRGNTVYIRMGGGCQGCAASEITLKQGIHTLLREKVREVGAIIDVTDHTAGRNPYYR